MSVYYPQAHGVLKAVFDGFGGDDTHPTIVPFTPLSCQAHLNGYREADTFEVSLDAKAFPFDPELLRALAVELYLFQTDGLTDDIGPYISTVDPVITGLADESEIEYSGEGRVFTLSGRDFTALMIDREWPVGKRIPGGKPLDQTVQDLVDEAAQADKTGQILKVRFLDESSLPSTGRVGKSITQKVVTTKPKVAHGHSRTSKKRGIPVRSGRTYWDVIYGMCLSHGFIVFVRGTDVVISKPHILTDEAASRAVKVAYGRDLARLHIKRHLGKETVPQILVTSYDPDHPDKPVEVRWPTHAAGTVQGKTKHGAGGPAVQITGIGTQKENVLRMTAPSGVRDRGLLLEYARNVYQNLGRSEANVSIETMDLKDLDGKDLLTLRPGDPIAIGFDAFNEEVLRQTSSSADRYTYLRNVGYSSEVARLVADNYEKLERFRQPFRVKDVSFAWSISEGLSVAVDGQNFISEARDDAR